MHPKFKAGGVGGAAALVLVFILGQLGVNVDEETAAALAVLLTQAGVFIGARQDDEG